jgi:hypothetical protein
VGFGKEESEVIVLRSVPDTPSFKKKQDVWVFYSGQPLPAPATDEALDQIREERDLANLGKMKWRGSPGFVTP